MPRQWMQVYLSPKFAIEADNKSANFIANAMNYITSNAAIAPNVGALVK